MIITTADLEAQKSCQIDLFERTFPGGRAEFSRANLRRAAEAGLLLHELARHILDADALAAFRERVGLAREQMVRAGEAANAAHGDAGESRVKPGGGVACKGPHAACLAGLAAAQMGFHHAVAEAMADALNLP